MPDRNTSGPGCERPDAILHAQRLGAVQRDGERPQSSGLGNLCHEALDRHVPYRPDEPALVCMATPGTCECGLSYGQLYVEVQRMAAILQRLGVGLDAPVMLHLPMIPEAVIALLAAARLGALHTWACDTLGEHDLAQLIDRVQPTLIISTDANAAGRHPVALKATLDEALLAARAPRPDVLVINQHRVAAEFCPDHDHDYHELRLQVLDAAVPCTWVPHGHLSQHLCHHGVAARIYAPLMAGMSTLVEAPPNPWAALHAPLAPVVRRPSPRRSQALRRFTRSSGG